ncbi:hypothetical protein [Limosilactobacillus fermentum]|uniref:hypothetical protein n=1 Tax=Limosilactobacillus fermentum TaxID=1613 RepID=UPI002F2610DB
MNYQQEKQAYDDRVKRLQNIEALDEGPDKGTPAKVEGVYSLAFDEVFHSYTCSECLASGPFDANFDKRTTINGQLGNYTIYVLDENLDPEQKIIIVQRGETARILKNLGVILTVNYNCTTDTVRNLAAALAILLLEDDTTVDEALTALINPQEDETKSDDDLVKRLQKAFDMGTPAKLVGVYTPTYNGNVRAYRVKDCLAAEHFNVNFDERTTINGQLGDYKVYVLEERVDPDQAIMIIQRGQTARIIKNFGVDLTFNYNCTPDDTLNLAAALAILNLRDDTTVDKALVDLINPQEDNRKSDF